MTDCPDLVCVSDNGIAIIFLRQIFEMLLVVYGLLLFFVIIVYSDDGRGWPWRRLWWRWNCESMLDNEAVKIKHLFSFFEDFLEIVAHIRNW